ncbi:phage portal protein [Desulfosporosinus sp. SB140]|uniref:phage portal protein n=1 Tax=Desulfosporosinus paludis TaxID=3115649 RepID=UPI0038908A2E
MNNISYWSDLWAAITGNAPKPKAGINPFYFSFTSGSGRPQPKISMNFTKLRAFSESPIPRRAVDYIKNQISMLEWDIVTKDGSSLTDEQKKNAQIIKNILEYPNKQASWRTFNEMIVEDLLVIGHSPTEKRPWPQNKDKPLVLYPFDAASLELYADWDGSDSKAKYAQVDRYGAVVDFKDSEIMYLRYNPRTSTPWGLSPLEVAAQTIDYLLGTQAYAGSATSKATARKALDLGEEIDQEQVKEFRQYWRDEVEGRGRMAIYGGTKGSKSIELGAANDEALFLKWQQFLINQIANAFGMDSQKFGAVLASRATGDILDDATDEGAIRPLAHSITAAINREIIQELGFTELVFQFRWTTNYKDRKSLAAIHQIYATCDLRMIDEIRREMGDPPLPNGKGQYTVGEYRAIYCALNTTNAPPPGVMSDEQKTGMNPGYNTPALQTKPALNQTANPLKAAADNNTNHDEKKFIQLFILLMLQVRSGTANSINNLYSSYLPTKDNQIELTNGLTQLYNDTWLSSYNRRRLETGGGVLNEVPSEIKVKYEQLAQEMSNEIMKTYKKELLNRLDEEIKKRAGMPTDQLVKEVESEIKGWLAERANYKAEQIALQESGKAWNDGLFAHDKEFAPETEYEVLPDSSEHDACLDIINGAPYTLDTIPAELPLHQNCPHRYYAIVKS